MKRFLLFMLFIAVASFACKKSKKPDVITHETLLGTWVSGSVGYIFRADSSYTENHGGFVGSRYGTFSTRFTDSSAHIMQTIVTWRGNGTKDTFVIRIASSNRLVVTHGPSTAEYTRYQ
ncbi:hypothetical protein AAHN97_27250 [Chitinophaga niabensis]|uniref:hypothetical protein n=1 Tax=Chitinophaga niabensis TaxID=536979 RepID=UPI0031BAC7EA